MRIDLNGPNIDLLEPLALTNYADQYIDSLQERAITDENITSWIEQTDAYSADRDSASLSELVGRVYENIRINMSTTTVASPRSGKTVDLITGFYATFIADTPKDAQIIAEKLAEAFIDEDRKIRTERAASASGFLNDELDLKRNEITRIEAKLAEFKEANANSLPGVMSLNMTVLDRTERDIQVLETEIRSLQQDKIFREMQLEEIRQSSESSGNLRQLEEEYLRLISIYGADHPDVVRIKRQVAAMTGGSTSTAAGGETGRLEIALAAARQRYSDLHPDVLGLQRQLEAARSNNTAATSGLDANPQYLQLTAQKSALDSRLGGLRNRITDLREKFDKTERRIALTPQVEREYLALNRDLQTEQLAFDDLRVRLAQAKQTESFESGESGARLVKIRSATLPKRPAGPPRVAILILGTVLAFAFAVAAAIVREATDGTVRSRMDVQSIVQTQPIAEIPVITISDSLDQTRRRAMYIGTGVILVATIIVVAWQRGLVLSL